MARRYRNLLDCCATAIYRAGHGNVAPAIDIAPSNLTRALTGDDRKLGVDHLEKFLDEFGDLEPVYYLVDKYLHEKADLKNSRLIEEAEVLMGRFSQVIAEIRAGEGA
ncbi:hypothetical protein F3N42_03775 [Marinihelvus fidelis]|uniref:Uncharacterized protein n=1 Tax=Marinihelvus fidelis TaxID=2613842 RepID=A0A5N0TFT1_9GAMM|nr:hypothetical protein [Marinihelvus fidelis]KAA9133481.1 hypothetical protein F3N42_03775 [Marinihelvus fidelis]